MQLSDFNYMLPKERIARYPTEKRDQSRLLRLVRSTGQISHHRFSDLPDLLTGQDLIVLNNTKVIPARLIGRCLRVLCDQSRITETLGARIEILLVKPLEKDIWVILVKAGRKVRVGDRLQFGKGQLEALVLERGEKGLRIVCFKYQGDFDSIVDQLGHVPLPPYIHRRDERQDRTRYQTIYASKRGAIAAPTAGVHFTPGVFDHFREKGVACCEVSLHVGLGTFRPVVNDRIEDHRMEAEPFEITTEAAQMI